MIAPHQAPGAQSRLNVRRGQWTLRSPAEKRASVPSTAILHLHDREWVYVPSGEGRFKRLEVTAGSMLPNNMQELISGLQPGQKVVVNPLSLQNEIDNR